MKYTIQNPGIGNLKEKRSEFHAYCFHINLDTELPGILKNLKKEHPDARHFCWAYKIHRNGELVDNFSDAGEPSGSAGLPILNCIKSNELVNCAIIVVRRFGGVKLGKRGLISAYRHAADLAVAESGLAIWTPMTNIDIVADIKYYGVILQLVEKFNAKVISDTSGKDVNITIRMNLADYCDFNEQFNELTQNSGELKKQSEHDQTKEVRK